MADIFISYAAEDRPRIEPLVDLLESRGWTVWWDREIVPGTSFDEIIEQELDSATCVVVVWSQNSVKSRWCRNEANEGLERGVLVPIRIDDVRLPLAFRSSQTASLIEWPEKRGELDAFVTGVSGLLATKSKEHPPLLETKGETTQSESKASDDAHMYRGGSPAAFVSGQKNELGGTKSPEALSHYVVGKEFYNVEPERALSELRIAVDIDPEFALAWVTMAWVHGSLSHDRSRTQKALADMATAAARAVSLAPDLWEAHAALGWYLMSQRDFLGADSAFEKTVEVANRAGEVPHPSYTQYLIQIGRNNERLAFIEAIQRFDPLCPRADSLYYLGRRDEAVAELERTRGARTYIGGVEWWRQLEIWLALERGDRDELDKRLFRGTRFQGLWGDAAFIDLLRQELESNDSPRRQRFAHFAIYAAFHGEFELALELLRGEYLRDAYAGHYLIWHPALSNVREMEGFKSFLRELGLVEMFRKTGKWNDYCKPVGDDDFLCR